MLWEKHINAVMIKLRRTIGILRSIRGSLTFRSRLHIYYSLFYSYMHYCILVYGTASYSTATPLVRAQNKMLRLIMNAGYSDHSTPLFKEASIIPFHDLYMYRLLRCTHPIKIASNILHLVIYKVKIITIPLDPSSNSKFPLLDMNIPGNH